MGPPPQDAAAPGLEGDYEEGKRCAVCRQTSSAAASSHVKSSMMALKRSRSMAGSALRTASMAAGRPSRSKLKPGSESRTRFRRSRYSSIRLFLPSVDDEVLVGEELDV